MRWRSGGSDKKAGGVLLITADMAMQRRCWIQQKEHLIQLIPPTRAVHRNDSRNRCQVADGSLQDVAPTVLALLGIEKPEEMTGTCLIQTC